MTQPTITDRDLAALFSARADGSINPDLAQRIHQAATTTRQRPRFLSLPGLGGGSTMRTLAFAAVIGASSLALAGLVLVGGDDAPVSTPPLPSVPPPATSTPSPAPSATPTPSITPTPLPPGTRTPPATIERPRIDGLGWLAVPEVDLFADSSESAQVLATLPSIGTDLFFMDGPVEAEGFVWWKVHPVATGEPESNLYPAGWVKAGRIASDEPPVLGYVPDCPAGPIPAEDTQILATYAGIACFGSEDFVVVGRMTCSDADVDRFVSGPDWLRSDRHCQFETGDGAPLQLEVHGDVVYDLVTPGELTTGRFEVTGHLDDAQAASCEPAAVEGAPTIEQAVLGCRKLFVATAVTRLD